MRLTLLLTVAVVSVGVGPTAGHKYSKELVEHTRRQQQNGYSESVSSYEAEPFDEDDVAVAATQVRRPLYGDENYPVQNAIPLQARPQQRAPQHQVPQLVGAPPPRRPPPPPPPQQHYRQSVDQGRNKDKLEEEEEEKEEPDRLSLLLPQSKFDCVGKNTGYYADEILNCEVFHYCQENVKHSWICPDGFTFHQVHLICMPPGADNICDKSSKYHFVNEYLYKPVNLEEHQKKPNVSLRYSERFYPDQHYRNEDYDDEEAPILHKKQPVRIQQQLAQSQAPLVPVARRPQQQNQPLPFAPAFRPEASGQVFRSSEEVNIPLNYRRPQYIPQRY